MKTSLLNPKLWTLSLMTAAFLAGCGGGVDEDDPHDDDTVLIDTFGRLSVAEKDSKTIRVHDLDANAAVLLSHSMDNVPSALYASPQGRYAVVMQRLQDRVQFLDGGVWQEDHVSHLHDYKAAPAPLSFALSGARPTHYDLQAGKQAAIFMDGDATASPAKMASVRLITDASIASASLVASLDLNTALHGLAEPVDNKLLLVSRAPDATDSLPTHLNLYQRSGSSWAPDRALPTRCDGMHGSFSSGQSTVAGCKNGMLLVKHVSSTAVDDGQLISTPLRVGTVAGHPRLPDHFIGIAAEGVAPSPVTTRFYTLDAGTGVVTNFEPEGWQTGRVRRAHGFDRTGQRFFVLDDQGSLIVSQRSNGVWSHLSRVAAAVPRMPTAAPWPAIVANGAKDEIYLTDPEARQLVVINSNTGAVITRHELGYTPSYAAWLGITR